jgi:superfamily II DNA or RNA helicase
MVALRDYQHSCRDAVIEGFKTLDSLLIELPTGTGKTVVFCEVAAEWKHGRTLIVCPYLPLIPQAVKKLTKRTGIMPDIEQADLVSSESVFGRNKFIVASKASLLTKRGEGIRAERLKDIGLIVFDEAHLGIKGIKKLIETFPEAKVLGVTATPKRHDKIGLHNVFQECVYQYGIVDAINDGWLVSPRAKCVKVQSMDLSAVDVVQTVNGKDFSAAQLAKVLEDSKTVIEVCEVVAREWNGEKTVVYCESVEQSRMIANRLHDVHGLSADWICADKKLCSDYKRDLTLKRFTEQHEQPLGILCNVGILTTGWDYPELKHIVMARPTRSLALYTQILGRGTRALEGTVDFEGSTPALRKAAIARSGKPFFRVTDLVDAAMEHKIITAVDALAGRVLPDVIERAKQDAEKNGNLQDPLELLDEAAKHLREEERQAEQTKRWDKWRKQLASIQVEVNLAYSTPSLFAGGSSIPNAVRRTTKAGDRIITCGKKKGQTFAQVGVRWCEWAADNHPNPGVKYGALRFLKESRNANQS